MRDSSGYDTYTSIQIKPVYTYRNVRMEQLQAKGGSGTYAEADLEAQRKAIQKDSEGKNLSDAEKAAMLSQNIYHVGDKVNMTFTPDETKKVFESYWRAQFETPGSTEFDKNCSGNLPARDNVFELLKCKCQIQPLVSEKPNCIRIEMDANAQKYFSLENLVPQSELKGTALEGDNVLRINDQIGGEKSKTLPVIGRVYTVEMTETAANNGQWRPVIELAGSGRKINGFAADILASDDVDNNVVRVTAEKYDPSKYEYFSVNGKAVYSSYALRAGSEPLTNVPAMQTIVTAGGIDKKLYDNNTLKDQVNRYGAMTDAKGDFSIDGIQAMPGDTISIKLDNNDMQQVQYIRLQKVDNDSYRKEASFDEVTATEKTDPNTGRTVRANEGKKVTAVCALNSITQNIDMPIRTPYSPYIYNVYYQYKSTFTDSMYNTVPVYNDELRLDLLVEENGAKIHSVKVTKIARNGTETEYEATKMGNLLNGWEVSIAGEELQPQDRFYAQITATPDGGSRQISYPILDTGLIMYEPKEDAQEQYLDYEMPNPYNGLPILNSMAGDVDSGKLSWKTVYADEKNKGTSPYAEIITVSVSTKDIKDNIDTLNELKNGKESESSQSWDSMIQDDKSDVYSMLDKTDQDNIVKSYLKDQRDNHNNLSATKEQAIKYFNENPREKERYRDEFTKNCQKKALTKSGETKMSAKVSLLLQLEYDYDPVQRTHFYSGGQYVIGATGNLNKTWYWTVYGVPVFLNINGYLSLQFDGRYVTDKGEKTAQDMGYYKNMSEALYSEFPWLQFGLGVTLQPGIGICGILSARGYLKFAFVARVNTQFITGQDTRGGTQGTFTGGVGVDLLVFSFDYDIGSIGWKTGVFETGKLLDDETAESVSLRPFDAGQEYANAELMSTLQPTAKRTLISGAMEYVRPQLIDLGDGRMMLLFLRNGSGNDRDSANAATLECAIRNADGSWALDGNGNIASTVVEADGQADSTPSAVRAGDKVYIAWTNLEMASDSTASAANAKEALQKTNIHMTVYDIASGTFSEPMAVTNDHFMNSNVQLIPEGDQISLYYFKKDVDRAESITDLAGFTNNYNSWARKVYDPAAGAFVELNPGKADPAEDLIYIEHPTIKDPMVLDFSAARYSYTDLDGVTKEYRFYSYTVDRDGDLQTPSDRELWAQAANLTDSRVYYPVLLDTNQPNIVDAKLTEMNGDVFLTWLSDSAVFNTIRASALFGGLNRENGTVQGVEDGASTKGSALKRIRALTDEQIADSHWIEAPINSLGGLNEENREDWFYLSSLAENELTEIVHDFGIVDDDNLREGMIPTDLQTVAGADGNLYLFWTAQDNEDIENASARELYGAAFYIGREAGSAEDKPLWSDAVKLTDYGKVLDELGVFVNKDKGMTLVGNLYSQTIDEEGKLVYGDHELAEIDFVAGNSLEITPQGITLSDMYPVEGQKVTASVNVGNLGLLPAQQYQLTVDQETETVTDNEIYPGQEQQFPVERTAGKDGALTVSATIREMDQGQLLSTKEDGAETATVTTKNGPVLDFGDAKIANYTEDVAPLVDPVIGDAIEKYGIDSIDSLVDEILSVFDPETQAILRATQAQEDYADYVLTVPVTNVGNQPAENLKATVTAMMEKEVAVDPNVYGRSTSTEMVEGNVLGEATVSMVPVKTLDSEGNPVTETVYAVIPLKNLNAETDLNGFGVLEARVDFTLNGEALEDTAHARRQIQENEKLVVNDGVDEITLNRGETLQLTVKAYPYDEIKEIAYDVENEKIVAVSEDGVLAGISAGTTYILVEDESSSNLMKLIKVTVQGDCPKDETCPITPFTDTNVNGWYHDGVHWALENGVMNGMSDTVFAPDLAANRAMIVTMLWRMDGEKKVDQELSFKDVGDNTWYTDAVRWGVKNGIVSGMSDTVFAPNENTTREQFATFLYRYANYCRQDVSAGQTADLKGFTDAGSISSWAMDSFRWAVGSGIIQGMTDTTLSPGTEAKRAQIATMLMRYDSLIR